MSFRQYGTQEIKRLLKAVDSHLDQKVEIILIGGTAALLAFKATKMTHDIDSFNAMTENLIKAYELAKAETGLQILMSQATVADAPFSFEERLVLYESLSFEFLTVLIPEIHDFILMKTVRGYEHDLDVIEEIFKKNKVEKSILIERFDTEMNHVIGHRNKLKLNFAAVLHRCFGEKAADQWIALAK